MEPNIGLIIVTAITVFVFSFIIGLDTRLKAYTDLLVKPKLIFIGLLGQYLLLPFIGVVILILASPPLVIGMGVLILVSAPGGAISNALVYLMRGDTALSVILTSISSFASPLAMATILSITSSIVYSKSESAIVPFLQTFIMLSVLVLVPLILGILVKVYVPSFIKIKKLLERVASVGLVTSVVGAVVSSWSTLIDTSSISVPVALGLSAGALSSAWVIAALAKLGKPQRVSIMFEVGLQNIALAILVAVEVMNRADFAAFIVTYGTVNLLVVFPMIALSRWRQTLNQQSSEQMIVDKQ